MKVTETLARYAVETSYRSLPKEVVHQGKRCFLDLMGCALGGSRQPLAKILLKTVKDFGGKPQATVWGHGFKTSVANAALVNGAMSHALDFDDTHAPGVGHPSAPLLPAVLAVAEWKGLSGKAALEAFLLGFEVETRIGMAMGPAHYDRGWHATSTFGRFGAAIAAGKLLGLSVDQMKMAIGLAGTQSCGLRIVFGTMTKPFHPGKAAYDGVLAAVLAQQGFTCAPDIIEGKKGYFEVLGEKSSLEMMVKGLGKKYEVLKNTFKPYAACLLTHPTINAVIDMRNQYGLTPEMVQEISCEVGKFCLDAAGQVEPKTGLAGKFSTYYVAALALAEGAAGEDLFTDKRVLDPKMVALRKKVKARVSPSFTDTSARVTITDKSGKKYQMVVTTPKGDPRNPPTDEELEGKFRSLVPGVLPKPRMERLIESIWTMEKIPNVRQFIRLCCA
ncbi:MAG TPA: MmgE/PrpD family protein [Thermodesulfobacteriota bacterium]|nr:MmgE/PrpD family protein [Thermodesulfobacteriota bacterium]